MEDYKNNEEKYSQFINSELKKTKTKNFLDNNKKEVILKEKKSLYELLSRPDTNQKELYQPTSENKKHYQRACVEIRYAGYIKKQNGLVAVARRPWRLVPRQQTRGVQSRD